MIAKNLEFKRMINFIFILTNSEFIFVFLLKDLYVATPGATTAKKPIGWTRGYSHSEGPRNQLLPRATLLILHHRY